MKQRKNAHYQQDFDPFCGQRAEVMEAFRRIERALSDCAAATVGAYTTRCTQKPSTEQRKSASRSIKRKSCSER